jgi:thioredoxin 1
MSLRNCLLAAMVALQAMLLAACGNADSGAEGNKAVPPPTAVAAQLPRLVDLGADKCIPCIMMEPVLEDLKTEYAGRMEVEFIDVWKNREQAAQYGVQMIPTQIFYDAAGKELFRRSGFIGKDDILAKWRELGYDFSR